MDADSESTTSTVPSKSSAARRAWWWAALMEAATVTHTTSPAPDARKAARKSAGVGVEVVAVTPPAASRSYRSAGERSIPSRNVRSPRRTYMGTTAMASSPATSGGRFAALSVTTAITRERYPTRRWGRVTW